MSGGSMNYLHTKVEYADFAQDSPERRAFAAHLKLVARALHDIEWVDSADYGPGDENEAIRACLGETGGLEAVLKEARDAAKALRDEINRVGKEIRHA